MNRMERIQVAKEDLNGLLGEIGIADPLLAEELQIKIDALLFELKELALDNIRRGV